MRFAKHFCGTAVLLIGLSTLGICCDQIFLEWNRGPNFRVAVNMRDSALVGVRVVLEPYDELPRHYRKQTRTVEGGIAEFTDVKAGRYYVVAKRLGIEVGPGTVIVGSTRRPASETDPIRVEWPLRAMYGIQTVSGRLQHHVYPKKDLVQAFVHPKIEPLIGAALTLSRIDTEKRVAVVTSGQNGQFDFGSVSPGKYILHIKEKTSREFVHSLDDDLLIVVDPTGSKEHLQLELAWSTCGMISREI
jgi:hypothetical protein